MIIESINKSPIFIHSLFRSGSTYIFNVFRRADAGYWCYQEPLHEITFFSRENPEGLQSDQGGEKIKLLRHPKLEKSYFLELIETWPAWKDSIQEHFVYDAYFSKKQRETGVQFWESLISAAKGRPVFQECRTSGRIKAIKNALGGNHIFLWRNPWDQWWSYKVNGYFDTINQLIIHASDPPAPVRGMLAGLGLPRYKNCDLSGALAFYGERPLTSEQSYLIFYMLWCLALKEGIECADLLFNIDRLSESTIYQNEVQVELSRMGINCLSFCDASIPQGIYGFEERLFFDAAEARVHLWLLEGGWRESDITTVKSLRDQYAPHIWSLPVSEQYTEKLVEQGDRFKDLAKRFETSLAVQQRISNNRLEEVSITLQKAQESEARAKYSEDRVLQLEARAMQSEDRALQSEARAMQSEDRARNSELRAQEAELLVRSQSYELALMKCHEEELERNSIEQLAHLNWAKSHASALEQQVQALYNSRSWKITAPLRGIVHLVRSTKKIIKETIKKHTIRVAIFVLDRTNLKKLALKFIDYFPHFKRRLRRLIHESGWSGSLHNARSKKLETSFEMTNSAEEVFLQLKNRIGAAK
jgi:hypothetical protein